MTRVLQIGMRGHDVELLRRRLAQLHFAATPGDVFDEATQHAVLAAQKVNHLTRDGAVGAATRAALRAPALISAGTRGDANRMVIDLSDQVLLDIRRGRISRVVDVSTGDPNLPDGRGQATPIGRFRVTRKVAGWHHAPLGELYYPSFFTGGIAIHGAASVPAVPASHGCVRVPMHLAQSIYDALVAGYEVQVRR